MPVLSLTRKTLAKGSTGEDNSSRIWFNFFRSENVPLVTANPISANYSKTIDRTICERAMGSKKGEILWTDDDNAEPMSFLGVRGI